jgi:hypothetical protein
MTTTETMNVLTNTEGHYILCEDCDMNFANHEFVGSGEIVWKLCDECNHEAKEAVKDMREIEAEEDRRREKEEEEDLGPCVSCKKEQAVISFMHLKNGNFELCQHCFEWADHEDEYGKEF